MNHFLNILKKSTFLYFVGASLITTILIITNAFVYTEIIKNNIWLLVLSLIIFYFLFSFAVKREIKDGRHD